MHRTPASKPAPCRADVAILGAGLAGTILARALKRSGLDVALIERGKHPRFALGESSTPLAALALERLAARFGLDDLHHLAAYGRWCRHLPHLGRGLKRGFTFYRHRPGEPFANRRRNDARLLVAASPHDAIADAHWLRADVDHHLVVQAVSEGVRYLDEATIDRVELAALAGGQTSRLEGSRHGERIAIEARMVVDGTGPAGIVARAAGVSEDRRRPGSRRGLLFAHLRGLPPFADLARAGGATLPAGPFPDDQAAVHHLLDEGWMYQLRFDHGVTSVGLLIEAGATADAGLDAGAPAGTARTLLDRYPTLAAQMAAGEAIVPWRLVPDLGRRRARAAGPGWFLLPHTFAFSDPMFSTGMAWSLIAVERLADLITGRRGDTERYDALLAWEADAIEHLVAGAYLARHDFARFVAQTFLYFTSVSFEEVRQRLLPADDDAWHGFLGVHEPGRRALFADAHTRLACMPDGADATPRFTSWVAERTAPFDIGGFFDPSRDNLHPLDLDVLVDRAGLLGLDRSTVRAALPRLRGERPIDTQV